MLSVISSVFDPLGIASPFVLPARILLQSLCKKEIGWDDQIGEENTPRWQQWLEDLKLPDILSVPRCLKPITFVDVVSCQLHVFSDACAQGYGIAAYVRSVNTDAVANVELLMGKARVAPLKKVTIPRMELTVATIAVKFGYIIIQEMDYKFDQIRYWTESMSVLRYIQNTSSRFHTFVANRLTTIHEASIPEQWSYVRTNHNPADMASRGLIFKNQGDTKMWLKGPEFLQKEESAWPHTDVTNNITEDDPEIKKTSAAAVVEDRLASETTVDTLFKRFSSWSKLKRIVAWILKGKGQSATTS
ncbi:uncharacterized protein LOC135500150 [Lineus longissimus]|uniref:uncharacterized protein LOC135500150 n=1 Tax=Lineus longissimus TaxID=88925 RepID=UPI00315CBE9E